MHEAEAVRTLAGIKGILVCTGLVLFWSWESWRPRFQGRKHRWPHALTNLALAVVNTILIALLFGTALAGVADITEQQGWGLLNVFPIGSLWHWLAAFLLLDGWHYLWHRANHAIPILWRFHRTHHSDKDLDVTSASRFHTGEITISTLLRLFLIPLLGLTLGQLLLYEIAVVAVTQFHHANISLGRWDRPLRWLLVTPGMHHVHHSVHPSQTNSNFATVFSFWDRLAGTWHPPIASLRLGLNEFREPYWQTLPGLLKTPFIAPDRRVPTGSSVGGVSS